MRTPTYALAWLAATAAAVAVSWLGVRTVVHDAVLSPPQLAVPAVATGTPPPTPPATTTAQATTTVAPTTAVTSAPPPATTTATPPPTSANAPPTAPSDVHSYAVRGGQVVLSLGASTASLVSATPANGFTVQVWRETGWLRVDFSDPGGTSSVFATWNGHPPSVQTFES